MTQTLEAPAEVQAAEETKTEKKIVLTQQPETGATTVALDDGTTFGVPQEGGEVTVQAADAEKGVVLKPAKTDDQTQAGITGDFNTITANGTTVGRLEDGTPVLHTDSPVRLEDVVAEGDKKVTLSLQPETGTATVTMDNGTKFEIAQDGDVTVEAPDAEKGVVLKPADSAASGQQLSVGENLDDVTFNGATVGVNQNDLPAVQTSGTVQLKTAAAAPAVEAAPEVKETGFDQKAIEDAMYGRTPEAVAEEMPAPVAVVEETPAPVAEVVEVAEEAPAVVEPPKDPITATAFINFLQELTADKKKKLTKENLQEVLDKASRTLREEGKAADGTAEEFWADYDGAVAAENLQVVLTQAFHYEAQGKKLDMRRLQEKVHAQMEQIENDRERRLLKDIKPGDTDADGWMYIGISEDNGKPLFVAPEDAASSVSYREAKKIVKKLNKEAEVKARIPSLPELKQIFDSAAQVGALKQTDVNKSWYLSSTPTHLKLFIKDKNLKTGEESIDPKAYARMNLRLVSSQPA